jgi:hypothetical protein
MILWYYFIFETYLLFLFSSEIRAKVEDHLERCKASFDPKTILHASVAAAPLAAWVKANISYSSVLESVAPLEKELDKVWIIMCYERRK